MPNTAKKPRKERKNRSGSSVFDVLERNLKMESWFEDGVPTKYFRHVLFLTGLGLLYISNTHYADRMSREFTGLKKEIEDLRADYTTLKADYMYESKQSEVAKKVKHLGLKEGGDAPVKVEEVSAKR